MQTWSWYRGTVVACPALEIGFVLYNISVIIIHRTETFSAKYVIRTVDIKYKPV